MMSPSQKSQLFANRLEALFERSGLKAEYIAGKVGISNAYLSRLRHGKATNPGFTIIQALAKVFDVSPSHFFWEEEKKFPMFEDIVLQFSQLDNKSRKDLIDTLKAFLDHLEGIPGED